MRLKLKSYLANEIDILLSWITTEKELRQWAGPTIFTWPINKKQLFNYLARTQGTYPEAIIFKAVEKSNLIVGHIEFDKIDWINNTTILSRVIIAPEFRNHGLGHEIVNLALNGAFNVPEQLAQLNDVFWITRVPAQLKEAKALLSKPSNELIWEVFDTNYRGSVKAGADKVVTGDQIQACLSTCLKSIHAKNE